MMSYKFLMRFSDWLNMMIRGEYPIHPEGVAYSIWGQKMTSKRWGLALKWLKIRGWDSLSAIAIVDRFHCWSRCRFERLLFNGFGFWTILLESWLDCINKAGGELKLIFRSRRTTCLVIVQRPEPAIKVKWTLTTRSLKHRAQTPPPGVDEAGPLTSWSLPNNWRNSRCKLSLVGKRNQQEERVGQTTDSPE